MDGAPLPELGVVGALVIVWATAPELRLLSERADARLLDVCHPEATRHDWRPARRLPRRAGQLRRVSTLENRSANSAENSTTNARRAPLKTTPQPPAAPKHPPIARRPANQERAASFCPPSERFA